MNQLDQLLKIFKNNLEWIKENRNKDFIKGYKRAMKDAEWLRDKIDVDIERDIASYFNAKDKDNWKYKKLQQIQYRKGGE